MPYLCPSCFFRWYHPYRDARASANKMLTIIKVHSHMRGADAGGGGRKIGFNTNHYMRSHMRGRGAEAVREQNPLRNKSVQQPIFHVRFETARCKPSGFSINGRSARVRCVNIPATAERECQNPPVSDLQPLRAYVNVALTLHMHRNGTM